MSGKRKPFSGIVEKVDGELVDLFSGQTVKRSEIKHGMSPISGTFLDKDGNKRDLLDFLGGLGGGSGGSGTTNHAALANLAFDRSGHTGFASAAELATLQETIANAVTVTKLYEELSLLESDLEEAINAGDEALQEQLSTAIADKQGQIAKLNEEIIKTNAVIQQTTPRSLRQGYELSRDYGSGDESWTPVPLSWFNGAPTLADFAMSKTWVTDYKGTCGIYSGLVDGADEDSVWIRTRFISPQDGDGGASVTTEISLVDKAHESLSGLASTQAGVNAESVGELKRLGAILSGMSAGMPYGSIGEFNQPEPEPDTEPEPNVWRAELEGSEVPDDARPVPFILDLGKIKMWQDGQQYANIISDDGNQFVVMYDGGVGERHIYTETNQSTPIRLTFTMPSQGSGFPFVVQMAVYVQAWDGDNVVWNPFIPRTDDSNAYPITIEGLQWIQLGQSAGSSALPPMPADGTYILGAVDGVLTWVKLGMEERDGKMMGSIITRPTGDDGDE